MRRAFPGFSHAIGRDRTVTWEGLLQPNLSSSFYRIKVIYGKTGPPRVFVLDPPLPKKPPHVWPEDGSLCLYWGEEWWWKDTESIAGTIMIWTALWLEYFEIWQETGEWLGPSSHDQPAEKDDDD